MYSCLLSLSNHLQPGAALVLHLTSQGFSRQRFLLFPLCIISPESWILSYALFRSLVFFPSLFVHLWTEMAINEAWSYCEPFFSVNLALLFYILLEDQMQPNFHFWAYTNILGFIRLKHRDLVKVPQTSHVYIYDGGTVKAFYWLPSIWMVFRYHLMIGWTCWHQEFSFYALNIFFSYFLKGIHLSVIISILLENRLWNTRNNILNTHKLKQVN